MDVIFHSLVPENVLRILTPLILLSVGLVIEKYYVNRVAMFTNAAALYIFFHPINMSFGLGILVNAAIIIGLIAGFSRLLELPLFTEFYELGWIASSFVTGMFILYGLNLPIV